MTIFIVILIALCALLAVKISKTPKEELEKLPMELSGFGIKLAAFIIAVILSIAPTKDLVKNLNDFKEKTPQSWKTEYYSHQHEYYYKNKQLSEREYEEKKRDIIVDYIIDEALILALLLLMCGVGSLIRKRSETNYELKKIRESLDKNNESSPVINPDATPPAFCSACGTKLSEGSDFCQGCGKRCVPEPTVQPQPKIPVSKPKPKINKSGDWKCDDCNTVNPQTAVACKNCGKYK